MECFFWDGFFWGGCLLFVGVSFFFFFFFWGGRSCFYFGGGVVVRGEVVICKHLQNDMHFEGSISPEIFITPLEKPTYYNISYVFNYTLCIFPSTVMSVSVMYDYEKKNVFFAH